MNDVGQISSGQFERIKNFLTFQKPPQEGDIVETIVVLGTSPTTDQLSFEKRCNLALKNARTYPVAHIILSGSRPDTSKGTDFYNRHIVKRLQ